MKNRKIVLFSVFMIISFCWIPPTLASTANSCSCSDQDLPITVDAGLETMHVIGGTTLQLTGTVDNPNVPDNLYTVVPSYTWSIINYGGLAAGTFNLSNPNSSITSLTTPKVTDTTIIIVRLEAEEWDCSCWDDVAITILPENSSSRSCSIYYATEDDQTGAIAGSKEKVNLSSSTAEVSLTAIIADFTSPVIRWTSSSGLLLNPYSANPVLNISGIRPSGTPVNVGLTVYEADNPDIFAFTNTFFVFGYRSENYSDDISIECTFNGITDSVKDGDLIVKEMDAATIQLQLQGFADEYADPKFSWEAGSNARLSETTGKTTLLTVSTPSDEIVVPVYLTVEENDGTDNNSISIYFILLGIEAGQPTEPIIEVFPSLEVTPGTQVKLKANAISSTGMSADRLSYRWDIQTLEGTKIDFLQNGRESIFSVPSLEEGASISANVIIKEGASLPAEAEAVLEVSQPTLNFAHLASGQTEAEELVMELVLLNGSSVDCDNLILNLFDSEGAPLEVEIDKDLCNKCEFSIQAKDALKIEIRNPDIEDSIMVGWIQVKSPIKLAGMLQYQYKSLISGSLVAATSLAPSEENKKFTAALDPGENLDMGIALANPNDFDIYIYFTLHEPYTADTISISKTIPAKGQLVGFISEIFSWNNIPILGKDFSGGTMAIEIPENLAGSFIATILRQSDGLLTTEPLATDD